jgi:hypothetical protein
MTKHREKRDDLVLGCFVTTTQNIFCGLIYDTAFHLNKIADLELLLTRFTSSQGCLVVIIIMLKYASSHKKYLAVSNYQH